MKKFNLAINETSKKLIYCSLICLIFLSIIFSISACDRAELGLNSKKEIVYLDNPENKFTEPIQTFAPPDMEEAPSASKPLAFEESYQIELKNWDEFFKRSEEIELPAEDAEGRAIYPAYRGFNHQELFFYYWNPANGFMEGIYEYNLENNELKKIAATVFGMNLSIQYCDSDYMIFVHDSLSDESFVQEVFLYPRESKEVIKLPVYAFNAIYQFKVLEDTLLLSISPRDLSRSLFYTIDLRSFETDFVGELYNSLSSSAHNTLDFALLGDGHNLDSALTDLRAYFNSGLPFYEYKLLAEIAELQGEREIEIMQSFSFGEEIYYTVPQYYPDYPENREIKSMKVFKYPETELMELKARFVPVDPQSDLILWPSNFQLILQDQDANFYAKSFDRHHAGVYLPDGTLFVAEGGTGLNTPINDNPKYSFYFK